MEPLVDAAWLAGEVGGGLWQQIETIAETGSTNAVLGARARDGGASGQVLVSDYQSRGRGRFTRVWEAPPGKAVALSVLLRPPAVEPSRWLWLPLVAGLAVADGLRASAGFLRSQIGRRVRIHTTPELRFRHDPSIQRGIEMSRLIDDAVARRADDESSDT